MNKGTGMDTWSTRHVLELYRILALISLAQGDFTNASAAMRQAVAMTEELLTTYPESELWKNNQLKNEKMIAELG